MSSRIRSLFFPERTREGSGLVCLGRILRGVPLRMTIALCLLMAPVCEAQTTQPADGTSLEFRANQGFTRNDYAGALPLLQKLQDQLKDQPDKLGPVEEQIRVCQKNIAMAQSAVQLPPGT